MMNFSAALHCLKNGQRVTREAYQPGVFVFLVPGSRFEVNRHSLLGIYPEGTRIDYHAHLDIRLPGGVICPWVPGQNDILADDWAVVTEETPL